MSKTVIIIIAVLLCKLNYLSAQYRSAGGLPHVLIYKTKANYRSLVPVLLSEDKTKIVSYPGPGDVKTGGVLALPVLLHKGYLLDRRGIGVNSAFTKYTYEEYSKLNDLPPLAELYDMIVDKNPLSELYDCGIRDNGKNSIAQLNELIDRKQLRKKCRKMK